jgi:hypothetical protein
MVVYIAHENVSTQTYKRTTCMCFGGVQWIRPVCIHYRNRILCRVSKTLGKGYFTLGTGFTLGKEHSANISSAKDSLPSAFFRTLGKDFCRVSKNTRQRKTLGKLRIEKIKKNIF